MTKFTKISCGKLYDGLKPELQEKMEILVEGTTIKEVGRKVACPEGAELIDLSHLTVTPGMIDAHMHTAYFHYSDLYRDTVFNSDGWRALAIANCAAKSLEGGFTTVRSVGWFSEDYVMDVKRAISQGYIKGARLIVAPHILGTSGSHGDMTQVVRDNPILMDFLEKSYPTLGNGPDFFVSAVRRERKLGGDFIKIMATGGFATPNDDPEDIQMSDAEFKAVLDTAKSLGVSVTAHAFHPELMQKLIRFGIQGIEHGVLMDEETARIFESTGTYLVPTFSVYEDVIHPNAESLAKKVRNFVVNWAFIKAAYKNHAR